MARSAAAAGTSVLHRVTRDPRGDVVVDERPREVHAHERADADAERHRLPSARVACDEQQPDRDEHRQHHPREDEVEVDRDISRVLRDLVVEAEPHEALHELVEPEGQRQHAQRELARLFDLRKRRDADPRDHCTADKVRFRGEAHSRTPGLPPCFLETRSTEPIWHRVTTCDHRTR